jgi:hypothetical protein
MVVYKEPIRRNRRFWATVAAFAPVVLVVVVGVSAALIRGYRSSLQSAPPATPTSGPTATPEPTPGSTPTATPTLSPTCPPTPTPSPTATTGHVTIDWWHVDAGDAGNKVWQDAADRYTAAHPRVTIEITLVDNVSTNIYAVMAQLQAAMDAGRLPDLLPSWGGGTMAAEADACMLRDITADVSSWKDELDANALRMHFLVGKETASRVGASGMGLPVTSGAGSSVTDPLRQKVVAARDKAALVQLYLDLAVSQEMSAAINAATARLFDGTSTPEQVCQAITAAAAAR